MERLIAIAWRAVWVALGVALVLVGQSLLGPRVPDALPTALVPEVSPQATARAYTPPLSAVLPRS